MRRYMKLIKHFGARNIKLKAVQALARLQDSVLKNTLGGGSVSDIVNDMAELQIYSELLLLVYDIEDSEVQRAVSRKMERLMDRVKR